MLKRTELHRRTTQRQIQHAGMNTTVGVIVLSCSPHRNVYLSHQLYSLTRLAAVAMVVGGVASSAPFLFLRCQGGADASGSSRNSSRKRLI